MSTLNRKTFFIALCSVLLSSCYIEDPGPRQVTERSFSIVDFDRLEMGSGLQINVGYGEFYSVTANGDRRNIDDLIVEKQGTTLVIRYANSRKRRHDTFIDIKSPELFAVTFSGASDSKVAGFDGDTFDVNLSGASVCQLSVNASEINVILSGASYLNLRGDGDLLDADISGASSLKAFNYSVSNADIKLSGASDAQVWVRDLLNVKASGASNLVYRGTPSVTSDVSGASSVKGDGR